MVQTQSAVRKTIHCRVDGGRSQGVDVAVDIRGTTDGDTADARDREPMEPSDITGIGDLVRAVVTSVRGGTRTPMD